MATTARILVADDQADVVEALRLLLKPEGYQIDTADSPAAAARALERREYDLVLMDLNYARDTTSGQEGLELLAQIRATDDTTPIVVMTAWGSVPLAVEAMRRGARDFIEKPWDNARLLAILRTQTDLGRALRRTSTLEAQAQILQGDGLPTLIAQAPSMQPVLQIIARVGPSDANVLILGENGTGKELVARELHRHSRRAGKIMLSVDLGAVAENLFDSELFG
ncbi:MAG TPA: response regulator, partial [Vicinamibacterales bacterium]|nr:response regulator [Vicinamibacterales bacterium]